MLPTFDELMRASATPPAGTRIGASREGRPLVGYVLGAGPRRVSLISGCHADEPVGAMLLQRLAAFFSQRGDHPALARVQWWIVPVMNPDGAERNRAWSGEVQGDVYSLPAYLRGAVRELPGDDVEFGFPRDAADTGARPENRAVYDWWRSDPAPLVLHASLHGMAFAAGPWFLVDRAWMNRCDVVRNRCRDAALGLGHRLHDVERHGDKGFTRIERGFCTCPDSVSMARHFTERGDDAMARRFRPSSMETARALGGDVLTLVSEMPLFTLPGVGEVIVPEDEAARRWAARLAAWKERVLAGDAGAEAELAASGIAAMPIRDQMRLQWTMIRAGLEQAG